MCRNRSDRSGRTAGQGGVNVQYIVIDGASTDGTTALLDNRRSDIDVLVSEKDNGIYDAMNKGLAMAKGRYISIINADDALMDDALAKVKAAFEAKQADIIHGNILKERTIAGQTFRKVQKPAFADMKETMGVIHPATFVAHTVYREVGLFDTRYRLSADYDFILRAYDSGATFSYLDEELSVFSLGGASNSEWRSYWETYLVHKRHKTGHAMSRLLMTGQCWIKLKSKAMIRSGLELVGQEHKLQERLIAKWSK